MKCEKFLDLAKKLCDDNDSSEVEYRTSISRAYNYAFILIRERHRNDKRIKFKDGDGDKRLIGELLNIAKERKLKEDWRSFTNYRNEAEYKLQLTFSELEANEFIEDVEDFIQDFKRDVKVKRGAS